MDTVQMNNLGQSQKQVREGTKVEDSDCHTSYRSKLMVVERSPAQHPSACMLAITSFPS